MTEAVRSILDQSQLVKTLVDEVNLGSQEQTRGLEQVSNATSQMDQVTQKTAATAAEESAAAAQQLTAQAGAVAEVVRNPDHDGSGHGLRRANVTIRRFRPAPG